MTTFAAYRPTPLAAHAPANAAWPLALWITMAVAQSTGAANRPLPPRASYLGATYRPQPAPRNYVGVGGEEAFEEAQMAAMPQRHYRVKGTVRSIQKGQLHL